MTFWQYFLAHWREHVPLALGSLFLGLLIAQKLFGKRR